ncbi:MAG: hypothetical protein MUF29_10145 [Chitinophagaceae bacterium]|jgi:hypothetical protein|nr:hypothetical protein [Chitinophagaceae bacterium]
MAEAMPRVTLSKETAKQGLMTAKAVNKIAWKWLASNLAFSSAIPQIPLL